ncbi:hypothetical protein C1S65_20230 [Pseudomonas putida]|uniref:Uncharacterized protein n=1 Tax=Pseudomonas putida TaxID=303 RepID=A0AAD0L8E1_PSEPU|nr:hypothetical protein C1S65_20230 [Pseudomonas putida]
MSSMLFTFYSGAKVRAWARESVRARPAKRRRLGAGADRHDGGAVFILVYRARSKVGKIKDDWTVGCQVKHDRVIGFQVFIGFLSAL